MEDGHSKELGQESIRFIAVIIVVSLLLQAVSGNLGNGKVQHVTKEEALLMKDLQVFQLVKNIFFQIF